MKDSKKSGFSYSLLKRRMIRRVLLAAVVAAVAVLILRELSRGMFADKIIGLIMRIFDYGRPEADYFYSIYIRNNIDLMMLLAIVALFIMIFRILLGSFTAYFNEVIEGIDSITDTQGEKIKLSPELEFVEQKLNNVKETLQVRSREAQKAEEQKNALVLYLAHDIKTPLTSVLGYLSLLDEEKELPPQQREKYTGIALEKAYRLETLVNEFFEITRYNQGSIPLHRENISLCYMMVQLADELYPALSAAGKTLSAEIDESITVYGDADRLARVFNNLLKNAIAYSEPKSEILVSAEERESCVLIRFESEGGIPRDKLEAVFDKFSRLNTARSSETGGSGLGLAIARDIVGAHGGSICADSDGERTVFTVELTKS